MRNKETEFNPYIFYCTASKLSRFAMNYPVLIQNIAVRAVCSYATRTVSSKTVKFSYVHSGRKHLF